MCQRFRVDACSGCRGRRRRNDDLVSKRSDESGLQNQEHHRVGEADAVVEGEPIESHANGRVRRMSRDQVVGEIQPIEVHANGRVRRMSRNEVGEENQVTQF